MKRADWIASMTTLLQRGVQDAGDIVFPTVCAYCDVDIAPGAKSDRLCNTCLPKLYEPSTHRCLKCAAQIAVTFQGPDCPWCREHDLRFDQAYTLGRYADDLREAVLRLKHAGEESLATTLARLLTERHTAAWESAEIDLIVPIPMHWWRRAWQGHNGPDLTAALIARKLKVYDYPRLLHASVGHRRKPDFHVPNGGKTFEAVFLCDEATASTGRRCCWSTIYSRPEPHVPRQPAR